MSASQQSQKEHLTKFKFNNFFSKQTRHRGNAPQHAGMLSSVMSSSLRPHGPQSVRRLCPWDSPGKNSGASCQFLLHGLFPTQGRLNSHLLGLLLWWGESFPLSHLGSPYPSIIKTIYDKFTSYLMEES